MRAAKWPYFLAGALALGLALISWRLHQHTTALAEELGQARELSRAAARLQAANRELVRIQPSPAELAQRSADHAAVVRLREEIERLKKLAESKASSVGAAAPDPARADGIDRSDPKVAAALAATAVGEGNWTNRGRDAPGAALETMLWAAQNGDIATVASMIALEGRAREKAEAMLASLSGPMRAQYDTPEKLIALFTARDVPAATRLVGSNGGANNMLLQLRLQNSGGGIKEVEIALRRDPDGWRLIVPTGAVEGYAASLSKLPAPP